MFLCRPTCLHHDSKMSRSAIRQFPGAKPAMTIDSCGLKVEHQRMKDFKACKPVSKSAAGGAPIARPLRVCNRKQSDERRVRWAYGQKISEHDEAAQTFAPNIQIAEYAGDAQGRRVRRDFVSAFLHFDCEKFYTYHPKDHDPDSTEARRPVSNMRVCAQRPI